MLPRQIVHCTSSELENDFFIDLFTLLASLEDFLVAISNRPPYVFESSYSRDAFQKVNLSTLMTP